MIVDNGYLKWSVTMPPYKNSLDRKHLRWSEWMESMRKNVECTFGILKGRWRILKCGVRLHGTDACDKVFKTCCALHNLLLESDGLDQRWEEGVQCDYETTDFNQFDTDDLRRMPNAVRELHRVYTDDLFAIDHTSIGEGNVVFNAANSDYGSVSESNESAGDTSSDEDSTNEVDDVIVAEDGVRIVHRLPYEYFRSKLVEHFDIQFFCNNVKWPQCNRVDQKY